MTTSVSRRLNVLCIYYSVLYNNAVRPVICEGWHVIHTWKSLTRPRYVTNRGELST